MKIVVYAISKNEEKFVRRFMESVREADEVIVLDTGSTDKTVELLRECGAKVYIEKITPWRFDVARNRALDRVPEDADLCVSLDLDEVIEKGWRKKLDDGAIRGVKQVRYRYVWSHTPSGGDGHVFWGDKIHARRGFKWVNAVHEVLRYDGDDYKSQYIDFRVDHFPDDAKPRSQYLPLLELSVREQPENDRNMHYLGREYMYYGMNEKAIETLKRHLEMKSATWSEERSASMRYIGVCYFRLGNLREAEKWYFKAIAETPDLREPYLYMAELYQVEKNYEGLLFACVCALKIKSRSLSYISEPASFSELPYDYASIACYNLGLYDRAVEYVSEALKINPSSERLKQNRDKMLEKLNK